MTAQQDNYENIITGMRGVQTELEPLNEKVSRIEAERQRILRRAVAELGDRALGQTITATNITSFQNWQVLQPFNAHNAIQSSALVPDNMRTYPGARNNYYMASLFRNYGSVTGEVVGIDLQRTSLVLKPKVLSRIAGASRYWVVLMDKNGMPLVSLENPEEEIKPAK